MSVTTIQSYTVLTVTAANQYGITYGLSSVTCNAKLHTAFDPVTIEWRVDDWQGTHVANGNVQNVMTGSTVPITFTPTAYGSYYVSACVIYNYGRAASSATVVSVIADGDRLPTSFDDTELELIKWGGLGLARLNTDAGLSNLGTRIQICQNLGLNWIVQFVSASDASPANCTAAANMYKGVTWEIVNEPQTIGSDYVNNNLMPAYNALKAADPTCKVLGPNPVNVGTSAIAQFVAANGLNYCDGFAVHDYQGNEQIDPVEWRMCFGAGGIIQTALANAGKSSMQVWVTERDISAYRGNALTATVQAVYLMWHINLLESMGIPLSRNSYYYASDMGYYQVPSWLYGNQGLLPGILMTHQRKLLIGSKSIVSQLDFGSALNRCFQGLLYGDGSGRVLTINHFGCQDQYLSLNISQTGSLTVYDAFGNQSTVSNSTGTCKVFVTGAPTYVILSSSATVTVAQESFGSDLAVGATASTNITTAPNPNYWSSSIASITDGTLQTSLGDYSSSNLYAAAADTLPVYIQVQTSSPITVSKAIVWSQWADNLFSSLLGYDLEYYDGSQWHVLDSCDFIIPSAWPGRTAYYDTQMYNLYIQCYGAQNFYIHRFSPVTASQFRISVRRASYGLATDDYLSSQWANAERLACVREFELYA